LILAGLSAASMGMVSIIAIIAIGLCNSIMFPTIFTLAIDGLKENTPKASGLLCMAMPRGPPYL
jgi:FHS family L-fucose permease-like MFS transporter